MASDVSGAPDEAAAPEYCDVIMKGGTASAIIYPPLLATLAKTFKLRNLAGTSAGSIGAALGAAAEFRRQTSEAKDDMAGYDLLDQFAQTVNQDGGILSKFEAWPATRPLWCAFQAISKAKCACGRVFAFAKVVWAMGLPVALGVLLGALAAFLLAAPTAAWGMWGLVCTAVGVLAAIVGGVALWTWWWVALVVLVVALAVAADHAVASLSMGWPLLGFLVLGAAAGAVAGVCGYLCWVFARVLPRKDFGICPGGALTDWLHKQIQRVANLPADAPLTFSQYQACAFPDGGHGKLRMITTCLSQQRPYTLPFETSTFWFEPAALKPLVGEAVLKAMVEASTGTETEDGHHLHPLPKDLPVAFAMRLSMALPVVLSAVPLWTKRYARDAETCPEAADEAALTRPAEGEPARKWKGEFKQVWFTDGGMTSNLPIHLFDKTVPRWPTVAINLDYATDIADPGDVRLAKDNQVFQPLFFPTKGLLGFIGGLFDTARNWQDSTQMTVPGQRDRIAFIKLRADEGGMNLDMNLDTMKDVVAKGHEAAEKLTERFGEPTSEGWRNHRWIRLLTATKLLEACLDQYQGAQGSAPSYAALLGEPPSYTKSEASARASVPALLAARPAGDVEHCPNTPKPACEMRIRPKL
jgi:predicted acylesterase/phospholipase RssA